ncbi:dnaJ homolog subfamily C member 13-like isoform X2 [Anneissia japonica]|uniref:dnaJ homolog subfamily C member 13-like isoform X2 n=1 Tax=Anneissia japonica TaxID=1529436 RepID=UPI0014259FE9|nr:dnaJ homolog subfamily C member 13-like isoform X2 [Anneissia japonica]
MSESKTLPKKGNVDFASYFTTKHSWRGKYKRIFAVGTKGVTTYNPGNLENTNHWMYEEFVSIGPNVKAPTTNEFVILFRRGKKNESMRFSTEHRADLITEALKFKDQFSGYKSKSKRFNCYKHHWSENRIPVILDVNDCGIDQICPTTNKVLTTYYYKDIEGFTNVSGYPGGFAIIYGGFSRLHLFASEQRDDLLKYAMECAGIYIGVMLRVRKEPITFDQFVLNRFGKYSDDNSLTSLAEFNVQKFSPRHPKPVRRVLCLTETCLVERDPATYNAVSAKPLCDVFALVRSKESPQIFYVEFVKGYNRKFSSTDRDNLIASVLDGVRASGNRDAHVKMTFSDRGVRHAPFYVPVDEEVEAHHLKFLAQPPGNNFADAVVRFNNNVSYSGLLHAVTQDGFFTDNKERMINVALLALLAREGDQNIIPSEELESQFQALRRLVASKAGFGAFTQIPKFREKVGVKVVKALKRQDDGVTHAAIDMLSALMQPMHDDYDLRQEQLNKASLLSSKKFLESLLDLFTTHVIRGTGALVITSLLDFLTFALCAPYSETTDGNLFDSLLEQVAGKGRVLYKLFQHPSMTVVKGAGLVMKAIIEEGDAEIAAKMQDLALAEGALPRHLHTAMFTTSSDGRMLTNRQLSRHLVALWVTGHPTAMALLKRILPTGLLSYLDCDDKVPEKERDLINIRDNLKMAQNQSKTLSGARLQWQQVENMLLHWKQRVGIEKKKTDKPIVLRKRRQRIKSEANWLYFYYMFNKDHAKPNLIWNYKTREELREAFENEMRAFNQDRELGASHVISWNHVEFEVRYECLTDEIKIGDYYLRLLLEADDANEETSAIKKSYEFFNDLYHRFLLTSKVDMKCMCLHAMAVVYGKCYEEIGTFNDTKYICGMLERCTDREERDRLILFLNKLILNRRNVKELINANGIKVLVDILTLAHLHTSRATVPTQTNVIEASPDMEMAMEKEWYYGNKERERLGPYSLKELKELWEARHVTAKTRCWAQGLDGWRPLHAIPQLKWKLLATGQQVMNESDLACLILNMLIRICEYYPSRDADDAIIRPLPKPKRLLTDAMCLPHIVQLLLTFDPILVEKVSVLVGNIVKDNPQMPRIYLCGVFFFIMMYTGSNVLPLAWFLKYTHTKQAFRSEENKGSDVMQRSILGHILPEAMVHFLENHSAEKFAETYLGEFDTPEAIWNSEMRRMMIEKIASHIADFTPRLQSNTRALYQYCPIPIISYPQLEKELFVNIYYLRHLCDQQKFPDWPIKDPVKLLKDILEEWKKEVEKKPPSMSREEAFETLKIPKAKQGNDEGFIRKAYFRLAQKYHPDKNPEGRDMFEKVNKAYEYLCTKSSKNVDGPDPENVVLLLKTQSILFNRYKEVLEPYKYAGYPMLLKTITLETDDKSLFSKPVPLLAAACELAFHTVNCSALNAEELRRENGIEILQRAFSRCVSILSQSSNPNDVQVQVCINVIKCYTVAAQFEACRDNITEIPSIIKDLSKTLFYQKLFALCVVAANCVSAFAVDKFMQDHLQQAGVIWHLLIFLFQYDFTLEESGVEKSGQTNQQHEQTNLQEVANDLARRSLVSLGRLAGFTSGEEKTPENIPIQKCLNCLLTPYLARQLGTENPNEVLKVLNSNTENPYLIWDNSTRAELMEYSHRQQTSKHDVTNEEMGADFVFSAHSKELVIGEIFVRVFNEQPAFPLEDAKGFTVSLLDYLGSMAQYLHSLMALTSKDVDTSKTSQQASKLSNSEMALEGLRNVIKNNPGTEAKCIGHFKLIFSLLRITGAAKLQQLALEVICSVTSSKDCVDNIADSNVLAYLLLVLHSLPTGRLTALETMYALTSNTKIVKESISKGIIIYLLDMFCNATNPTVREKTAELLAKILTDKLMGPRIRILLSKFLPPVFMDAMRDSHEASIHMFEGVHENPELIWNEEAREKVSAVVRKMKNDHFNAQKDNPDATWKLPEEFAVVYTDVEGELTIAGVFLRLFISQPSWVLRKPREFMVELLEKFAELISKNNPDGQVLEAVTTAIVLFFTAQPTYAEQVPQLGHIPNIFQAMGSRNSAIPKSSMMVVHRLVESEACVRSMAQNDCIGPFMVGMRKRPDQTGLACEAMHKMFQKNYPELVAQALERDLIPFLLTLLESGMRDLPNPSGIKAQIVKSIKAMLNCLENGEKVQQLLDKSDVWAAYKDQKHDLFISESNISGYLTGPGVAGYLTQGQSQVSSKPPPMDTSQDEVQS